MLMRRCSAASGTKKRKRKREGKAPNPIVVVAEEEVMNQERSQQEEDQDQPSSVPLPLNPKFNGKGIFILENAALNKGFVKKKWKILNTEEDNDFLLRQKKNLDDYRSDIVYKALRAILDSPINKVGMVGAIYVKINNGALFEVKPHTRLPRTLKRFSGLILELLEKHCVRTRDTRETLLRIIEEPVTRYLPTNSRIIGLSHHSEKLVDIEDYVSAASDDLNLVFVLGGKIDKQYTDDFI